MMIPTPMATKPRNAMAGPTTMRRVLKMSGLKASSVDDAPSIRMNPRTIITAAMPMTMKFIRTSGSRACSSCSMLLAGLFDTFIEYEVNILLTEFLRLRM